jgi:hypothetical protein
VSTFSTVKSVDVTVQTSVKIYPNPAANYVVIDGLGDNDIVMLLSVSGQRLNVPAIRQADRITLNISNLPKGAYFVQTDKQSSRAFILLLKP